MKSFLVVFFCFLDSEMIFFHPTLPPFLLYEKKLKMDIKSISSSKISTFFGFLEGGEVFCFGMWIYTSGFFILLFSTSTDKKKILFSSVEFILPATKELTGYKKILLKVEKSHSLMHLTLDRE